VAATAGAALLAAGCGSVHYHGAAGRGTGRAAVAATPAPPVITPGEAERLARALLSRAPLPAGALRRSGPPVAALSRPPSTEMGSPSVALHGLWTIAEPMTRVAAYVRGHPPAGMTVSGSGQAGQAAAPPERALPRGRPKDGGVQPGNAGTVVQEFVSYQPRRLPAGVSTALLSVAVAPAGRGVSELRADAQVIWYRPRSPAEYVPAGMRAVTITAYSLNPKPHSVTRTFGAAATVRPLAALLNGAHAFPGGAIGCPLVAVSYRLAFASAPRAAPYLTAAYGGCLGVQVTAGGRAQPALAAPAGLGSLLAGLMHVRGGPGPGGVTPNSGAPVPGTPVPAGGTGAGVAAPACGAAPLNGRSGTRPAGLLETRDAGTLEMPCLTTRPAAP
jgi:hypothetical protein